MSNYIVLNEYGEEVGRISGAAVEFNFFNIRPAYTLGNIITVAELARISRETADKLQKLFAPFLEWVRKSVEAIFKTLQPLVDFINNLDRDTYPYSSTDRRRLHFTNRFHYISLNLGDQGRIARRLRCGHRYSLDL